MKTYIANLTHSDIWKDDSAEPVTRHKINGVTIEIDTDGGNWWIEDVIVDGLSYNSVDTLNPSNFEGPECVSEMLTDGVDIETAAEKCGAKWMVSIGDYRYFWFPQDADALDILKNFKNEIVEKTLDLMPIALSGDRANRAFFFKIEKNGELTVDYHYYLGLISLDDSCFLTIPDHETPDPEEFGFPSIEEMDFDACGYREFIENEIDQHIANIEAIRE